MNRLNQENLSPILYWLSPLAIRQQANRVYELAIEGKTHFSVHLDQLPEVVSFVKKVTLENYPDLNIPMHSRWGHFQVGGVDRLGELRRRLENLSPEERCRVKLDLVLISVLLDAGSGPSWKYHEAETGLELRRSEGLAVASLRMFLAGAFSSDPRFPLRVDSQGLRNLSLEDLQGGFQVSSRAQTSESPNSLSGLEGRLNLLHRLGETLEKDERFSNSEKSLARPGFLYDGLMRKVENPNSPAFSASALLLEVLLGLGPIWPARIQRGGISLGDTWEHPEIGLVPFHKLSQWLTYSLIEPLEEGGVKIQGLDELTGLAEYRNGGLVLDSGLIQLRDPSWAKEVHSVDSPLVIEWRALTLCLLDRIAEELRRELGKTSAELPLVKVLEGGTWWAGRKLAAQLRPQGAPPLRIESDGTVY